MAKSGFFTMDSNGNLYKNGERIPEVHSDISYPLVKLGWADASEAADTWFTIDQALEWAQDDDWIVHQVGWILKETDDFLLLASRYNDPSGGREGTFAGVFKIPKPWIKYRIEITNN